MLDTDAAMVDKDLPTYVTWVSDADIYKDCYLVNTYHVLCSMQGTQS